MAFSWSRMQFKGPNLFPRFVVSEESFAPLRQARLRPSTLLLVAERGGERRAFLMSEMAYHHVAEGAFGDEPFAVTFGVVCRAGVGLTPVVGGRRLSLSAGGVSDTMMLLVDDQTGSCWLPSTGQAVQGPLTGQRLPTWPIQLISAGEALQRYPDLRLARSGVAPEVLRQLGTAWTAPVRREAAVGSPRPEIEHGLGVVVEGRARYYPLPVARRGLRDEWDGRALRVQVRQGGDVPMAEWEDGGHPFQLFTRWYGFSLTFPDCRVVQA